jgi:hypothetical protein
MMMSDEQQKEVTVHHRIENRELHASPSARKQNSRVQSRAKILALTASNSTHPSLFPHFNNYSARLHAIKSNASPPPSTMNRKKMKRKSPIAIEEISKPLATAMRPESPDKVGDRWSFIVGGKYNSPRCINLDHNRHNPQYLRRSVFSNNQLVLNVSEEDNPYLRERRREYQKHSVQNVFHLSESPPRTAEGSKREDIVDNKLLRTQPQVVPQNEVSIEVLPAIDDPVKLPKIRPRKSRKKKHNEFKADAFEKKNGMIISFKEFDRANMSQIDNEEYDQMLDPNNFPVDLYHTIDYLRSRKNMLRNNYKNFSNRSQRNFTAYRHFVNYKMAVEAVSVPKYPKGDKRSFSSLQLSGIASELTSRGDMNDLNYESHRSQFTDDQIDGTILADSDSSSESALFIESEQPSYRSDVTQSEDSSTEDELPTETFAIQLTSDLIQEEEQEEEEYEEPEEQKQESDPVVIQYVPVEISQQSDEILLNASEQSINTSMEFEFKHGDEEEFAIKQDETPAVASSETQIHKAEPSLSRATTPETVR